MRKKVAEKRAVQAQVDAKENRANDVGLNASFLGSVLILRYSDVKLDKICPKSRRIWS